MQTLMSVDVDRSASVDPVEEMRLRAWARRHYAPLGDRDSTWHPIVLEEMNRRDQEFGDGVRKPR